MPEPFTDQFRDSAELETALKNPNRNAAGVPRRAMIRTTDDEIYQFRVPNQAAFKNPTEPFELPDGLQTDGTQHRQWGDAKLSDGKDADGKEQK